MAEYKGDIKGFPKEVVDKMLDEMELDGNARSIEVLERSRSGGFSFEGASDGYKFWRAVVDGDFWVFFDKYPKTTTTTTTEYEGNIKGFPKEVVDKMLERQVEAGNPRKVSVFELSKWSGGITGFEWGLSIEGQSFWEVVISDENFDVFFGKYPKDSEPAEEPKVEIDETFSSVDGFIDSNKDALQEMSKDSPIVFDALNNVLAELRVAYEGAKPAKKVKKKATKVKKEPKKEEPKATPAKKKPAPKVVVEEEEEIDLDSLMEDMEDMDDLMDDIDNLDC